MKNTVIEIITCSCPDAEKFNKLFPIYNQHPYKSPALAYRINAMGYKKSSLEQLIYELKKLFDIRDLEVKLAATSEKGGCSGCGRELTQAQEVPLVPANQQGEPIPPVVGGAPDPALGLQGEGVPYPTSDGKVGNKKLREDYPFLNDENCPENFKILAADKLTAWNKIISGREILLAASEGNSDLTEEELAAVAQGVAEADELNALIHEEFEHYKSTGEILAKHPIFFEREIQKKIDLMSGEEKAKRLTSLKSDIGREKTNLKKAQEANDTEKALKIEDRLKVKEIEFKLLTKSIQ